jgi:hypothetical protein
MKEIQQCARQAGLPFAGKSITPLLTSLQMLGFLEIEEEGNKRLYFKSPLITEPSTKIDWEDVIVETKALMKETWPEIADEYIGRYCENVELINPFTLKEIKVGTKVDNKTPVETTSDDYGSWYEG